PRRDVRRVQPLAAEERADRPRLTRRYRRVRLAQDALLVLSRELPPLGALDHLRRWRGGSGLPDLLRRRRRWGLGRAPGTNPISLGRSHHGYLRPPRLDDTNSGRSRCLTHAGTEGGGRCCSALFSAAPPGA